VFVRIAWVLYTRLFSQTLLLLERKKLIIIVVMLIWLYIFEKRAANLIEMQKNNSFYVKIGLWILTTNFTKTALYKKRNETAIQVSFLLAF